jgi:hypothetical protein
MSKVSKSLQAAEKVGAIKNQEKGAEHRDAVKSIYFIWCMLYVDHRI